ncbi:hypothetical protein CFC21_092582 [Triticum aestivum]|uniref:Uncharacterized protein n=2 Tax=Triticum aestivum TaxID=4565 RepID=A0A9R1LIV2_WHEAT|nr:hypothetical protein CFC21_092582 [Triticum aestivum]
MDRPSTSTNPLFLEQDSDPNNYVTKLHLFGTQRALHEEQLDRIDNLPPTCDSPSNAQETTSTTSSTSTSTRMTQEWTRFVPCWSTALLPLRPTQEGAARVDTPTTPSPTQVPRHRILFVVPRVKIVKLTAILYTHRLSRAPTSSKPSYICTSTRTANVNANKNKRSERDNTKMHKMPRHNDKNNNSVKLKHLRRNVPFDIQVTP